MFPSIWQQIISLPCESNEALVVVISGIVKPLNTCLRLWNHKPDHILEKLELLGVGM